MPDPVDPKAFLTLDELAIANMYELEAIGELLEQRGVMTKAEIIALAKDLKRKTPPTEPRTATTIDIPSQPRFTDTDNAVIEEIMAVILQHGLSADQAQPAVRPDHPALGMGEAVCARAASGERLALFTRSHISFYS